MAELRVMHCQAQHSTALSSCQAHAVPRRMVLKFAADERHRVKTVLRICRVVVCVAGMLIEVAGCCWRQGAHGRGVCMFARTHAEGGWLVRHRLF